MSASRFVRPEPPEPYVVPAEDLRGFRAGVVNIAWAQPVDASVIAGRDGRVLVAQVTDVRTQTGRLKIEDARATLHGTIVRAPDGALSRITGVQTFLMPEIMVNGPGGEIGLLLVPVEEL